MNLLAHSIAEGLINPLVAPDARETFELARDDGRKEVSAVTLDFEHRTVQTCGDEGAHVCGGWITHG